MCPLPVGHACSSWADAGLFLWFGIFQTFFCIPVPIWQPQGIGMVGHFTTMLLTFQEKDKCFRQISYAIKISCRLFAGYAQQGTRHTFVWLPGWPFIVVVQQTQWVWTPDQIMNPPLSFSFQNVSRLVNTQITADLGGSQISAPHKNQQTQILGQKPRRIWALMCGGGSLRGLQCLRVCVDTTHSLQATGYWLAEETFLGPSGRTHCWIRKWTEKARSRFGFGFGPKGSAIVPEDCSWAQKWKKNHLFCKSKNAKTKFGFFRDDHCAVRCLLRTFFLVECAERGFSAGDRRFFHGIGFCFPLEQIRKQHQETPVCQELIHLIARQYLYSPRHPGCPLCDWSTGPESALGVRHCWIPYPFLILNQRCRLSILGARKDPEPPKHNWKVRFDLAWPDITRRSTDFQGRIQDFGQGGPVEFWPQGGPEPKIYSRQGVFL